MTKIELESKISDHQEVIWSLKEKWNKLDLKERKPKKR